MIPDRSRQTIDQHHRFDPDRQRRGDDRFRGFIDHDDLDILCRRSRSPQPFMGADPSRGSVRGFDFRPVLAAILEQAPRAHYCPRDQAQPLDAVELLEVVAVVSRGLWVAHSVDATRLQISDTFLDVRVIRQPQEPAGDTSQGGRSRSRLARASRRSKQVQPLDRHRLTDAGHQVSPVVLEGTDVATGGGGLLEDRRGSAPQVVVVVVPPVPLLMQIPRSSREITAVVQVGVGAELP